jgi:hypothetical protein
VIPDAAPVADVGAQADALLAALGAAGFDVDDDDGPGPGVIGP